MGIKPPNPPVGRGQAPSPDSTPFGTSCLGSVASAPYYFNPQSFLTLPRYKSY